MYGWQIGLLILAISVGVVALAGYMLRLHQSRQRVPPERVWLRQLLHLGSFLAEATFLFLVVNCLLPFGFGLPFALLLISQWVAYLWIRRRDAVLAFQDALRCLPANPVVIADLALTEGWDNPSLLGTRLRAFAEGIYRGANPLQLAQRLRLPLDPAALLQLEQPSPTPSPSAPPSAAPIATGPPPRLASDQIKQRQWQLNQWPISTQALYIWGVWIVAIAMFNFIAILILPTLQAIADEFAIETHYLDRIWIVYGVFLPATWLIAVWVATTTPLFLLTKSRWLSYLFPVSGTRKRHQQQALVLQSLGMAFEQGGETTGILEQVAAVSRGFGIRPRLRAAAAACRRGVELPAALQKARLINRPQAGWLAMAMQTDRCGVALRGIANEIDRISLLRYRVALSIIFPILIVTAGVLIAGLGFLVLGILATLILELAVLPSA